MYFFHWTFNSNVFSNFQPTPIPDSFSNAVETRQEQEPTMGIYKE